MNEWAGVFLALMALALLVMAAIQVGVLVLALRLAKQMSDTAAEVRQEIKPLIQKANSIADEASRATALATLQVERVDQFMSTTAARLDATMGTIQNVVSGPVGQGAAALSAFRAVMTAWRDWKGRRRQHAQDEDDALFVG